MQLPKFSGSVLIRLFVVSFALSLPLPAFFAATLTWTGLAGDGNVATAGNWSPPVSPAAGDTLLFAGTNSLTPQSAANLSLAAMSFASGAGSFTLGGAGAYTISTAAGITNNSVNLQTINNDIKLGLDQTWTASSGAMSFGGVVNLNNSVLTIDGSFNTTISGQITSGGGSLTKNGAGTLTLSGSTANNYGGTTTVNGGTLVLAKTSGNAIPGTLAIGDGVGTDTVLLNGSNQINNKAVTINSSGVLDLNTNSDAIGTLTMTGGSVMTETGTFTLGGNVTTNAFTASATISGNFNLGANRTFTVADGAAADDLLVSANITSGGAILTKAGAGRMVLSGSNVLKDVAVSEGTLTLRNSNALGTGATPTVSSGATLELEGGISIDNAIKLNGTGVGNQGALLNVSGDNTVSGAITQGSSSTIGSNSGTLTISGTMNGGGGGKSFDFVGAGNTTVTGVISNNGSVTMDGTGVLSLFGVNTYSGGTTINSGTVAVNNNQSLGATGVAATINAGTLEVTSSFTATRNFTLGSSSSTVQVDPGQTFTVLTTISGTGTLNKTGSGTLVLGIPDTYLGGTNIFQGTVQITTNNALPSVGTVTVFGGTLDTQTSSDTVGPVVLKSGSIIGSGTLTSNSSYTVESGSISAPLAGNVSMTKNTSGTVTLSGNDTFTGSTTVNAGTLVLATSTGSALGSTSAIIVNSSGTLLFGANNQINNSAGITLNGGTFAKGNFSEGTTSAVGIGALTLTSAGSHLDFGTGTVGALSFASFGPAGTTLAIDNWTGTPNTIGSSSTDRLIFDADQSANLTFFSFTGYLGATEFNLGGGFWEVVPVAVPEPSTWTAGALGLAVAIYALRRRRSFDRISRHGLVLCAAFSVSSVPVIQAAPTDEIIRAVSVHGVADVSQASAKQFSKAFFAVALRVDPDDLPNYVDAAVKLRPDLAPTAVAIALKVAWENWRTTSDPMLTSLTRHSTTGRAALCELIGQIVKRAVLAARDHAPEIARAAVATCPEMRQCILTAAIGAAPEGEEAIMRALTSSSPPADTYHAFGFSLKQEAQVASPEQPPPP